VTAQTGVLSKMELGTSARKSVETRLGLERRGQPILDGPVGRQTPGKESPCGLDGVQTTHRNSLPHMLHWTLGFLTLILVLCSQGCQPLSLQDAKPLIKGTSWSSSGSWIAILETTDRWYKVRLVNVGTKESIVVAKGRDELEFERMGWKPGKDEFCYISVDLFRPPARRMLRVVDSGGDVKHSVNLPFLPSGFGSDDLAWTSDGDILAVADVFPPDKSVLRLFSQELQPLREVALPFHVLALQWNPDDKASLIVHGGRQYGHNLCELSLDTEQVTRITTSGGIVPWAWRCFPSGKVSFLYGDAVRGQLVPDGLYSYDITSQKLTTVLSGDAFDDRPRMQQCAWAPEQRMAAVVSGGCIYTVDLATSSVNQVTEGPSDSWPSFSPDTLSLAFVRNGTELCVRSLANDEPEMIYSTVPRELHW